MQEQIFGTKKEQEQQAERTHSFKHECYSKCRLTFMKTMKDRQKILPLSALQHVSVEIH